MRILESLTKTFRLFVSDEDEGEVETKIKVIVDPAYSTIKIVTPAGTGMIYEWEAEGVANMILQGQEWMRVQRGEV